MNEEYETLLDQWESKLLHKNKCFIKDGIIDQKRWIKAPRKILFINKEAHDGKNPDSYGFDLRDLILNTWKGRPTQGTYKVVATWAYALHYASTDPMAQFPRWDKIDQDEQCEALLSCAVINIKKSGGKTTSSHDDLEAYVKEDGILIKKQIDLINPEIIVCGHVWYLIKELWKTPVEVYNEVLKTEGRIIIDFWHPSSWDPEEMKYYALAALIQNSGVLANRL